MERQEVQMATYFRHVDKSISAISSVLKVTHLQSVPQSCLSVFVRLQKYLIRSLDIICLKKL